MNKHQEKQAKQILDVLESQRFADWYQDGGRFDNYIRVEYPKGHEEHVTKKMVLEDIVRYFKIAEESETSEPPEAPPEWDNEQATAWQSGWVTGYETRNQE
jgi:hypothetical protein